MHIMKVKSLPGPNMGIFLACLRISIECLCSYNDHWGMNGIMSGVLSTGTMDLQGHCEPLTCTLSWESAGIFKQSNDKKNYSGNYFVNGH